MGSTSLLQHVYPLIKPTYLRSSSTHPHPFKVAASLHIHTPSTQPAMITMMNQAEAQRAAALELIQALVYRQDERLHDLCLNDSPAYHAFLSPKRLPALDDLADSPAMRMKQLLKRSNDMPSDLSARPSSPTSPTEDATHGAWSPLSNTTLDQLLASRLKAFGTATMCSERVLAIMQDEDVCAIRWQERNRLGALDKTSTLRLHFTGNKIDSIDEYVDARKSSGYERAVGAEEQTPVEAMPKPISVV